MKYFGYIKFLLVMFCAVVATISNAQLFKKDKSPEYERIPISELQFLIPNLDFQLGMSEETLLRKLDSLHLRFKTKIKVENDTIRLSKGDSILTIVAKPEVIYSSAEFYYRVTHSVEQYIPSIVGRRFELHHNYYFLRDSCIGVEIDNIHHGMAEIINDSQVLRIVQNTLGPPSNKIDSSYLQKVGRYDDFEAITVKSYFWTLDSDPSVKIFLITQDRSQREDYRYAHNIYIRK